MTNPGLEERMARLEGGYEQINHRIGSVEGEIRELRREFTTATKVRGVVQ